ncbi:MAG: nucleotidyltransferase family protein [Alphaproteobacteria bacterium]|nr:nucleotidyltransferase family protein [Alphaproteobacteria bacterium]MDE2341260.1 nucleotidyltransferase family protein [Alphaproteobacteria bacterium]
MVMAAGLGKRMRPLTATRPKPLIRVAGKALIDHVFEHLLAAGVERIIVNVHYLADAVEAHLARYAHRVELIFSDERVTLLETGGGMMHARSWLGDAPFFCVNADNFWIDGAVPSLDMLRARWDLEAMDALLLLVPLAHAQCHGGRGDFHMDALGRIARRKHGRVAPFVMSGVQILNPAILADPPGAIFSTNIFWDRAIARQRCYGIAHSGLWFDVGTPQALPVVEAALADG